MGVLAVRRHARSLSGSEAEELREVGDSIVAAVRQFGAGGGSGAETELRYFQVWTFRGGTAIRLENFRERAEALEAVGLS
jgi:ketosteroid isomerase-like protein